MGKWVVVLALVVSTGGHWFALQSVAWVGMAFRFARNDPLVVALEKTFDGRHPCQLCKAVAAGQKSERKQASLKVETKLDFWLVRAALTLIAPAPFVVLPDESGPMPLRAESPPTPPPRLA
jgi:hypothetical protein